MNIICGSCKLPHNAKDLIALCPECCEILKKRPEATQKPQVFKSNSTQLLCCPFCGTVAISEDHDDNGWYVACGNDDCEIRPSFWGENKAEAEKIWSTRAI